MEFRELAEHLLMANTLEQKLKMPEILTDHNPNSQLVIPEFPERPDNLSIRHAKQKKDFPSLTQMKSDSGRGQVLHFFANHELLAIELMALALLKFPNADKKFRRSIVATIGEEQEHLRLYQQRMEELGVGFGDVPISRYFWDCLSHMSQPIDYVVGMSMTFEQANLDFSLHYRNLMIQLGDEITAAILQRVYEEEIGHLKSGVSWFESWRDPNLSQWQSYTGALVRSYPLSAVRAKGIGFDRKGRKQAGLEDDFLEQLGLFAAPKGRDPLLYWYNADAELELEQLHKNHPYHQHPGVKLLMSDFETLPGIVANHGDVVLCRRKPSHSFIRKLTKQLGRSPYYLEWDESNQKKSPDLKSKIFRGLHPWAWTPSAMLLQNQLDHHPRFSRIDPPKEALNKWFRKTSVVDLRRELRKTETFDHNWFSPEELDGRIVSTWEDLHAYAETIRTQFGLPIVAKSMFGFSGSGMSRIYLEKGFPRQQEGWIKNQLKSHGMLLVEPYFHREYDLSVVWQTADSRLGLNVFLTDKNGQFRGMKLGPLAEKFHRDDRRTFLSQEESSNLPTALTDLSNSVRQILLKDGLSGPIGLDYFVYRWPYDNKLYVRLVGEVNARMTMGHIGHKLDIDVARGRTGYWLFFGIREVQKHGFLSMGAFRSKLLSITRNSEDIVFTNDPDQAKGALSVLIFSSELISWLRKNFKLELQ
ncbi:MAG: DUF455 family protein [Pseudobacteriovorax sp.]|nr:DUF455 family protein [Pseudobacteriovorax sp.]